MHKKHHYCCSLALPPEKTSAVEISQRELQPLPLALERSPGEIRLPHPIQKPHIRQMPRVYHGSGQQHIPNLQDATQDRVTKAFLELL